MKRRRPGRPPLGETAASETLRLRVRPADAKRYRAAAASQEVTLSEWFRRLADRALEVR